MNEHAKVATPAAPSSVTTGPIAGSRKVYASPMGRDDVRIPFREITLSDTLEPPVRVYDASGPYTDPTASIELGAGLAPMREGWIAKRGYAAIEGRADQAGRQWRRFGRPARAPLPGQAHLARRRRRPARHPI